MKNAELRKRILQILAMAIVLVLPVTTALAMDVSDWAGIKSAYNGWQSAEFTLLEDVAADSTLDVPSWHALTITLNDHTITPPSGQPSAFTGDRAVTYVVDDAAEFAHAAADSGSKTIRLAGDITLQDSVVLANCQSIETGSHTLTLAPSARITAQASTFAAVKSALSNPQISSVTLTADSTNDNRIYALFFLENPPIGSRVYQVNPVIF